MDSTEARLEELQEYPPLEFAFTIEQGKIEEFADATFGNDEIFRDGEKAREAGFDSIPAPITFVETYRFERERMEDYPPDSYFDEESALHGAQEYEISRVPVAGEELNAKRYLEDAFIKEGSSGKLVFGVFATEYKSEGELLIKTSKTRISVEGQE